MHKWNQAFVNIKRGRDDGWTVPCHLESFTVITMVLVTIVMEMMIATLCEGIFFEECDVDMMAMMMIVTPWQRSSKPTVT